MPNINNIKKYKKIYMIGIGGVSMSGIAEILINWGFTVAGSDRTDSNILHTLKNAGIQINTKLNLVEGINSDGNITGTLYNKFLKNGDFFKIKITETPELIPFIWTDGAPQNFEGSIEYVYLYY